MPDANLQVFAHEAAASPRAGDRRADFPISFKLITPRCYRSDERLRCGKTHCAWRDDCCRLIAKWKR